MGFDMDKKDAEILARSFLAKSIELEYCAQPPQPIYNFNPAEEYLFTFQLDRGWSIGSSPYIGVSRETGAVRYLGRFGE